MIEVNLYNDGAYIVGHGRNELCTLVSYAISACIDDCLKHSDLIEHFESARYKEYERLGLTFVKLLTDNPKCLEILDRFKVNLTEWIECNLKGQIKVNENNTLISWDDALKHAKEIS